jgi:hypothetical protein
VHADCCLQLDHSVHGVAGLGRGFG